MKFSILSKYFEEIEKNSSRLTITNILAKLFKDLSADEVEKTVYLLQGRVAPAFDKIDFGMAEKMIIKAIITSLNLDRGYFEKEFKKLGDLGKAGELFKKQHPSLEKKDLSVLAVYNDLYKLATAGGEGSQELKINILANLIRQLDHLSCRYIVRIPQGVMRLGFSDMTVLDSFSWMIKGDKSLRAEIEKAYHVRPDLGFIGKTLKEKGIKGLEKIEPKIFTPIIMMKAERLSSGEEIIKQIGRCAVESKYDGFRLQVHYKKIKNPACQSLKPKVENTQVRLYSRSLEEVSEMYPDIIMGTIDEVDVSEAIFEGEAVGIDPETGSLLPFQETAQRKRKYGIEEKIKEIPLRLFVFELLYLDQKNYIHLPFSERRRQLEKIISDKGKIVCLSPQRLTDDPKVLDCLFDKAVKKGLEGILAKKLTGVYQPGARAWNWIKFKKSYSAKVEDTVDCLVMGYDYGKGKRTSFGIGAFLVGIYHKKQDKFLTVAKIGTGLTDDEWKELKLKTQSLKLKTKPENYQVDKMMECDMWLAPKIVVDIRSDEITKSPVHTAKLALRFPRLERFRDDKNPDEVTTLDEVEKMYKKQ